MSALKLIIQGGCLIFLATITLILARQSRISGGVPGVDAPDTRWNYSQFEFNGPRITDELGRPLNANLVFYDLKGGDSLDSRPTSTNRLAEVDQLLQEIGHDGWQFVWTNGTNFITRRAEGSGHHSYFIVEYLPPEP